MADQNEQQPGTETERYDNEELRDKGIAIMLGNGWQVQSERQLPDGRYEVVFELGDRPGPV